MLNDDIFTNELKKPTRAWRRIEGGKQKLRTHAARVVVHFTFRTTSLSLQCCCCAHAPRDCAGKVVLAHRSATFGGPGAT